MNSYYFECVRCGQTLRTTADNPTLRRFCGKCEFDVFREIPKVEYEAANGRFEIPK